MRKMFLLLAMSLLTVSFLLINPLVSIANVRIPWQGPYYARIEWDWTLHTVEWAAVPFYRDPDCVPDGFNLLDFYDFENALNCDSLVEGFETWKNGPGTDDLAPLQISLKAAGPVPVYFVPWSVMQVAREDGVLTMPELEGLDGLRIGIAKFFTETVHPYLFEGEGGAQQNMIEIVANGYMKDDNSVRFELKLTSIHTPTVVEVVKIEFKPAKPAPAMKSQPKLAVTWGEMKGKN